jgi:hypothetical protein
MQYVEAYTAVDLKRRERYSYRSSIYQCLSIDSHTYYSVAEPKYLTRHRGPTPDYGAGWMHLEFVVAYLA